MGSPRQSLLLALAASLGVHAAVLIWVDIESAPRPDPPAASVIKVTLTAVQIEPVSVEKPAIREPKLRPAPRPASVVPQAAPREEPVAEPVATPPVITQSAVETPVLRVPAPAPEPPPPVASVAKARAREPDPVVRYLHNPPPPYPWQAKRLGIEGRVVLQVEILQNGNAGRVEVWQSSGHEVLDQAALKAVGGWRFDTARAAGAPGIDRAYVPISFRLTDR